MRVRNNGRMRGVARTGGQDGPEIDGEVEITLPFPSTEEGRSLAIGFAEVEFGGFTKVVHFREVGYDVISLGLPEYVSGETENIRYHEFGEGFRRISGQFRYLAFTGLDTVP